MAFKIQQKLQDNIGAIYIALEWERGQSLSDSQMQSLKRYSNFGGLKAILYSNSIDEWIKLNASKEDLKLYPQSVDLHQLLKTYLNEQEYKSVNAFLKNIVLTAFYTSEIILQIVYKVLNDQGIKPGRIHEPGTGAGVFISEAASHFHECLKKIWRGLKGKYH